MDVRITDVVLRDGLQDEDVFVSTVDKRAIAEALVAAGIRDLEVTSFVSAKRVPQLADAEDLLAAVPRHPGVRISAIALNARGAKRAAATRLDELRLVVSAGGGHSVANAGRSTEQALDELVDTVARLPTPPVLGAVSTAFVCPYDGPVPTARLLWLVRRLAEAGVRRVNLADTLGTASPAQVLAAVTAVREELPDVELGLHLHDANGQALSTVDLARSVGVTRFDSALGGLGGCPFAPGSHGNLATEALVGHLHGTGVDTGVDEVALAEALRLLRAVLRRSRPLPPA